MAGASVILRRRLRASPANVFEACSTPSIMAQWFGPKAFDVCEVHADVRVGGEFSFRMRGERGYYGARGIYREVTPPIRLVLTWMWTEGPAGEEPDGVESLLTFEFRADDGGTLLILTHSGLPDQDSADSHRDGWTEALQKLVKRFADDAVAAVARTYFASYPAHDRLAIDAVVAPDFHFTSPRDNRIDRQTYFDRCWPNNVGMTSLDVVRLVIDGDRATVTYEATMNGKRFRNTEVLTVRDDQVTDVEVYFGWPIPHRAAEGGFVDEIN